MHTVVHKLSNNIGLTVDSTSPCLALDVSHSSQTTLGALRREGVPLGTLSPSGAHGVRALAHRVGDGNALSREGIVELPFVSVGVTLLF